MKTPAARQTSVAVPGSGTVSTDAMFKNMPGEEVPK
jgi:hypothetical protein